MGFAGLAVAALTAWSPGDSDACENAVVYRVDPRVARIQEAERLASTNKSQEAIAKIMATDPQLTKRAPGADPLTDRALIVLARSTVRSDGKHFHGHTTSSPTREERDKALRWAAHELRRIQMKKGDDPVALTDLAEALSHVPAERAEALKVFSKLVRQDVVASPQGYAALASIYADAGAGRPSFVRAPLAMFDRAKREIALSRCARMTKAGAAKGAPTPDLCAPPAGS